VILLAPGSAKASGLDEGRPYQVIRTPAFPFLRELSFVFFIPWLIWVRRAEAVIHTVWLTALISHLWSGLLSVPYFVSVHASEILDDNRTWRRRLKGYLKRWRQAALVKAGAIFSPSDYTANRVRPLVGQKGRIQVIPHGVDIQFYKPMRKADLYGRQKTLLTVSRLDLHKGHDRVLVALAILKEEGLTPRYIIAGLGEQEMTLRTMTRRLGLEHQVVFAGFVPESQLPALYNEADIFIMASREIPGRLDLIEGFGLSFLEASASGLPVIAGRSGGVANAVKDEETGLLVDPDSPDAIASAIRRLLLDPDFAHRLGSNGRRWTEKEMNWGTVARRVRQTICRK
jgi:phosphatidylinositol alpha-1,6-mannosyltransferase